MAAVMTAVGWCSVDEDDDVTRVERQQWWCRWRVTASGYGDRVDPMVGSLFGFGRKSPPENFSGGGGMVVAGIRRDSGGRGDDVVLVVVAVKMKEVASAVEANFTGNKKSRIAYQLETLDISWFIACISATEFRKHVQVEDYEAHLSSAEIDLSQKKVAMQGGVLWEGAVSQGGEEKGVCLVIKVVTWGGDGGGRVAAWW
ncbi:hypothetical protein Tco_0191258 [Tanacetum coccineum]